MTAAGRSQALGDGRESRDATELRGKETGSGHMRSAVSMLSLTKHGDACIGPRRALMARRYHHKARAMASASGFGSDNAVERRAPADRSRRCADRYFFSEGGGCGRITAGAHVALQIGDGQVVELEIAGRFVEGWSAAAVAEIAAPASAWRTDHVG